MSQRPRLQWFRWEGVYTADFTLEGVRRRCRQLGDTMLTRNWSCLIAHDTRFMSGQFARYAYRIAESQGVRISFGSNPASIPMVELALEQRRADCALVVSAGNRPHWYNGLIVIAPSSDIPLLDVGVQPLTEPPTPAFPSEPIAAGEQAQVDLRAPYIEMLRASVDLELIRRSTLTMFVDAMNGTTSGVIPAAIGEGAQTRAIEINRENDPLFGRQTPHPSEAGLNRIRKLVKESDSHLGVAISSDGRALGVTDNVGDLATPFEVGLLLAQYLARQHRQKGLIVAPQPPDDLPGLRSWEGSTGLKVELSADPAARIADLAAQDRGNLLLGVTAWGEMTIGRYGGTPDAVLAALLLIEMIARTGGRLRGQLDELRERMTQAAG